jgi:hypothetical protein
LASVVFEFHRLLFIWLFQEKKVPPFLIIQFGRSQRAAGNCEKGDWPSSSASLATREFDGLCTSLIRVHKHQLSTSEMDLRHV